MTTTIPFRMYRCEPPAGGVFETAVIEDAQGVVRLYSTRTGTWARETDLGLADMVFPMVERGEWEIERIEPRSIEIEITDMT